MTAHQRWLEQPTAEDDDSAELARRERLAQAVRESVNPVDRLIVKLVEEGSTHEYVSPYNGMRIRVRSRTVDEENLLISDASAIRIKRWSNQTSWDEANCDAMCLESPTKIAIYNLIAAYGNDVDDLELARLVKDITRKAFAEACVSAAEDLWP